MTTSPSACFRLTPRILLSFALGCCAAVAASDVQLPERTFPESITSTSDGTLIIGSLGKGMIFRAAKGAATAEPWIQPGTNGLNSVLGVLADEKSGTLWVCSNSLDGKGEPTALKTFNLKTGAPKGSYPITGENALCNDIVIAANGTAYVADTRAARVLMLKPGAKEIEVAAKDPLLAGADGLAFGNKVTLYVNSYTTGKFLRLEIGPDGKAGRVTEMPVSRKLERPDGMRAVGANRFLMVEGAGNLDLVTLEGLELNTAVVKTVKAGFEGPTAVTPVGGTAWVIEGKLNYFNDPAFKGKDPGPFKVTPVEWRGAGK